MTSQKYYDSISLPPTTLIFSMYETNMQYSDHLEMRYLALLFRKD